jgi:5-methylcytosine-specific restriction protein A
MAYIRRVPSYRTPSAGPPARAYEQRPSRQEDKNFYSSTPWLRVRRSKLLMNPLCVECEGNGLVVAAKHVHHVIDRKQRPDLALDLENLQSLCAPCHNAKRKGVP